MAENTIEILSDDNPFGVVHRMKFKPIIQQRPNDFHFCALGQGNEQAAALLINGLYIDLDKRPDLTELLRMRAKHAIIMLFIPDISSRLIPSLKKWSQFVDVFLLPTPEMQKVLQLFTERPVEVLFDPIDFGFTDSFAKSEESSGPFKVVWFGFPDSYRKSMTAHERALIGLHIKGEIEYHIVTKHNLSGDNPRYKLHHYNPETFPSLLQTFDACVLSHTPADFDLNTYCKSENKAVLSINRGVPVIASRTPAYERLLTQCGLEEYLFSSNIGLVAAINRLRPREEQSRYLQLSQKHVAENFSSRKMVRDWLDIYERTRQMKFKRK